MKHILIIILLWSAILLPGHSYAQSGQPAPAGPKKDSTLPKIEFGIKLGADFQTISGNTWNHDYKTGIVGGITVGIHKKKIGMRIEVLASTSSYSSNTPTDSVLNRSNIKTISIDIPVLFEYNFIHWLTVQVGPQYSNLQSAKDPNNLNQYPKIDFKQGGLYGVLGLEAKLPAHISAGARYILGLTNINNGVIAASSESWKTSTIQVYVGYRFQ